MENTPPELNIPQLIALLKELITKKPKINKKLANDLNVNLDLLENPDYPDKEPYLPIFFFLIFKHRMIIDDFVSTVLYQLRKTQLYYSFPHVQKLEAFSTKYFCELYSIPPTMIRYMDKEEGKQMGSIAIISQPDGSTTKFYIKTQRKGRRREEFGLVVPGEVDTRELFDYKVLEFMKICPEVHFYGDDAKDCYLAVKDSKINDETNEERFICTYKELKDHLVSEKNVDFYHFKEENENLIPPILFQELTFSYLISLILVISDTFTSYNNIIYLGKDLDNLDAFHIIDFYATNRSFEYDSSIFQAFVSGAGVNERTSYDFTKYVLMKRPADKRIDTIKQVFNPDLFNDAVERAFDVVKNYPFVKLDVLENERSKAHEKCNDFWTELMAHENDK